MAIHLQDEQDQQKGFAKTIDAAGMEMAYDILQRSQYSFPIKSIVREILSNAVDSVVEKQVAKQILTGKAKVEDFYVDMQGDVYKDSRFDPSYYNLQWLSNDDIAEMRYVVAGALQRDKVIFKDYGVGLFGKRLEGYFKLMYSTKRLSKLPLGKYGLGAKSPLSIDIPYYTMESRYNGKLMRFNIYKSKVDSIIPEINMDTGEQNPYIMLSEGTEDEYKVHYLPTTEKNGLTITLEAKKHHLNQYIEAIRSQMLYFDNIRFVVQTPEKEEAYDYKAKILYEDDLIVVSDNPYYSKPHILLNKVNYGYIAWDELELEEKNGNIGIKVAPEDVEVNPSRESVMWTDKTKQKVLDRFNQVVDIAGNMIQQELKATDFVTWLRTCFSVQNRYSERGGVVGRLAKIVDLNKAKFRFLPKPDIVFTSDDAFNGLFARHVQVLQEKDATKMRKKKVIRDETKYLAGSIHLPIYLMAVDERASNRKDKYLFSLHPQGFLQVQEPYDTVEKAIEAGAGDEIIYRMGRGSAMVRRMTWESLMESEHTIVYSDVEVPENFNANDEDVETIQEEKPTEEQAAVVKVAQITANERRKAQGKTLVSTPSAGSYPIAFPKFEVPIAEINNWNAPEIYYGYEDDSQLLQFVTLLTRDYPDSALRSHAPDVKSWEDKKWWRLNKTVVQKVYGTNSYHAYYYQNFFDAKVMLVKVSKANGRYYRDFPRIQEFFFTVENDVITMSNFLIKWNTARLVAEQLNKCAFLYNYPFHPELSEMYNGLCQYVARNYRLLEPNASLIEMGKETYNHMISHLDSVYEFQKFVAARPNDKEGIGSMAAKLFGNKTFKDGMAVDPEIIRTLQEVLDYAIAVGPLFNSLPMLTGWADSPAPQYRPNIARKDRNNLVITEELEHEIRTFLQSKGVLGYLTSHQEDEQKQVPVPMEEAV